MFEPLYLIPLFPLIGFLLNGLLLGRLHKNLVSAIGCGSVLLSFIFGVKYFLQLLSMPENARVIENVAFAWIPSGQFHVNFGFLFDPLSAVMVWSLAASALSYIFIRSDTCAMMMVTAGTLPI